jgi:HSP20 family protein
MVDFKRLVPWRGKPLAPARRQDVFDPFVAFRREVGRMFEDFFSGFDEHARRSPPFAMAGATPSIDLNETDKELIVIAELPGLEQSDLEVTVAGDVLTLKGEKRAERRHKSGRAHYVERRFDAFSRSVRLPFAVDGEDVEAKYHRGVLTVRIPKPADQWHPTPHTGVQTF